MRRLRAAGKPHAPEVDTEGSWAISYGDMITLLLTFFILFFSMDKNASSAKAIQQALIARLAPPAPLASLPPGLAGDLLGHRGVEEEIRRKLAAEVHVVGNRLLIEFPKISFFDFSQTELTREGRAALQAFVELYMPYAGTHLLSIRAFTDQKPVRAVRGARFQDNLELSALRAVASMRVLQRAGIPLQRMKLGGYGELNLAAAEMQRALAAQSLASPQNPVAGLALARKVAIVIEPEPPMKDKL